MAPPSSKNLANPTNKSAAEPTKLVADAPAAEPVTSAVPATEALITKVADKKPLTIMVPSRLWRQLRLLASVEGSTLSAIFLTAVEKDLAERLRVALARITDVE